MKRLLYITHYLHSDYLTEFSNNPKGHGMSQTYKSDGIARVIVNCNIDVEICSLGFMGQGKLIPRRNFIMHDGSRKFKIFYPILISQRGFHVFNQLSVLKYIIFNHKKYDYFLHYNISWLSSFLNVFYGNKFILDYEDNYWNKNRGNGLARRVIFKYSINNLKFSLITAKNMLKGHDISQKFLIPGFVSEDVKNLRMKPPKISESFNLVFAGGIHSTKGFKIVLLALKKANFKVHLDVYTDGVATREIEEIIRDLPDNISIKFNKYVTNVELLKCIITTSHACLSTTLNLGVEPQSAGFPFKIIQYAMTERPIISSELAKLDSDFNRHILYFTGGNPESLYKAISDCREKYAIHHLSAIELRKLAISRYSTNALVNQFNEFFKC